MSTSSDGPADPSRSGSRTAAPLPPPIASSPPSPAEPVRAPAPAPTLTPSSTPPVSSVRAGSSTVSPAPIGTRDGDLTPRWRSILAAAWIIAFFAYAAVWQASVQIGIGTWWVGPRAQPTPILVKVLPSLLSISMAMCAIYNVPRLVRLSAMGVLLATIVAIPDFSRSIGLGVAELVIAALLGLVTVAASTGRYRLEPDRSTGDAPAIDATGAADGDAAMAEFAPPDQPDS